MKPNQPNSNTQLSEWDEITLAMEATEELLTEAKRQLAEAQQVQSDRANLQAQKQELERKLGQKLPRHQKQEIKAQLQDIQTRLETIELAIAEQLVSWSSFKEPFWQVIRFGGLGFLLGVLFKSFVG